jgi:LDH2 family malate/lactate/ureidoglycolate dehydrogenase
MPDILVRADDLIAFCERLLLAHGAAPQKARLVAESLVAANLRGVDSHGVQLLVYYLEQIDAGDLDLEADGRVLSESGACLHFDAQNAVGQWVAEQCCDHALRLARGHGLGFVVARDSAHFGACAWWAQRISREGMIGIVYCNASPIVPPWQGREGRVGTNPICISIPGPWLLDMATTTVAAGKIYKSWFNGVATIPAGWALDREGSPTTDTQAAYQGWLMPLGGYKGSGLAMMVEILCAVLGGGAMSTDVGSIRWRGKPVRCSQAFLAIDIARFMPVEEFRARAERLVEHIKSTPAAAGYDEVLVAGEPEWRMEAQRRRDGIPIGEGTWDALRKAGERAGVRPQPEEAASRKT